MENKNGSRRTIYTIYYTFFTNKINTVEQNGNDDVNGNVDFYKFWNSDTIRLHILGIHRFNFAKSKKSTTRFYRPII